MKKYKMLFSVLLLQSSLMFAQVQTPEQQKSNKTNQQKQKDKTTQQRDIDSNNKMNQQNGDKVDQTQTNVNNGSFQVYDNFEGNKSIIYIAKAGTLDSVASNPMPNDINKSEKCAKYVRNRAEKFDNIKMSLSGKLTNVDQLATYDGASQKIKMKVYTTAPVGTLIEIQLGKKNNIAYPQGINSQYQTYTTKKNSWEEVEFKFSVTPDGSETGNKDIDQLTLLFSPNSNSADTYYFDDITGPMLMSDKNPAVGSRK
ncbi:MAG: hypothetical protein H0W84_00745 [Bacteroidetes bacterium]|nr:hypothetical protein [Bacteroidota bacterium]